MEFENPLVVTVDGKVVYETVIGGEEDMKLYDQVQNGALDKPNARLKNIRFTTTAGPHKVGVTFRRRTFAESDDVQQMFTPGGGQDRMYRISSFQVRGPFNPKGVSATPSRDRIFGCYPPSGATPAAQARCAQTIIASLARRAYRRPVTANDTAELFKYYEQGAKDGASRAACAARVTGHPGEPVLPLSRRARAGGRGARQHLHHQRSGAGVEAVVLPVEHDPGRRAAAACRRRPAQPAGDAAIARCARMLADPRSITLADNFAAAVARHEAAGRDRARPRRSCRTRRGVRIRATTSAPSWRSSPTASSVRIAASSIC